MILNTVGIDSVLIMHFDYSRSLLILAFFFLASKLFTFLVFQTEPVFHATIKSSTRHCGEGVSYRMGTLARDVS